MKIAVTILILSMLSGCGVFRTKVDDFETIHDVCAASCKKLNPVKVRFSGFLEVDYACDCEAKNAALGR